MQTPKPFPNIWELAICFPWRLALGITEWAGKGVITGGRRAASVSWGLWLIIEVGQSTAVFGAFCLSRWHGLETLSTVKCWNETSPCSTHLCLLSFVILICFLFLFHVQVSMFLQMFFRKNLRHTSEFSYDVMENLFVLKKACNKLFWG